MERTDQIAGKLPLDKHLFARVVKLLAITPDDNFKSLGPTPSKPVALVISRVERKLYIKLSSLSGRLKYASSGTFELTKLLSLLKSIFSIGSFKLAAI